MPLSKTISVHTLVKNEMGFVWFSVMSVINQVDEVKIWDTGSTDNTKEIIQEILKKYPNKVSFKEVGDVNPKEFTVMRQKMLDETEADWVMLVDGDEVWWESSINELKKTIESTGKENINVIVSPFINAVGDIFHYQEDAANRYEIDGRVGNYTIRAFRRNIEGLHLSNDYGREGFIDSSRKFIQESQKVKRKFINKTFLHLTHLARSSKDDEVMQRAPKLKYELGIPFPKDFYYPEVFFRDRAAIVPSPWKIMTKSYKFRAFFETPLRKFYRRTLLKFKERGY